MKLFVMTIIFAPSMHELNSHKIIPTVLNFSVMNTIYMHQQTSQCVMTRCLNTNWVAKFLPGVSLSPNIGVSKQAMGSWSL